MTSLGTRTLDFLRRRAVLGVVSGIPVLINYSWFIIFVLLTIIVYSSIPRIETMDYFAALIFGMFTVSVFFGTLFLHEFAHAVVARREGIPVTEILLHPFGGVAHLQKEPETPGAEFRIAIAGPVMSLVLAACFLLLFAAMHWLNLEVFAPFLYLLFLLNLFLAIFNLFPGFPLDGGRVLRAILWRRGMEFGSATILTGKFGQIIGTTIVVLGIILVVLRRDYFTGFWSAIVGIFLVDAATGFIRRIKNFENLKVRNVMEVPVTVSPDSSIMECVDRVIPFHQYIVFPVATDRHLYGFLVLEDLKKSLPRERWRKTLVRDAMRPVKEEYFIDFDRPVGEARELLNINGLGALGVIDLDGKLVGFVQRGRIRRRN